jgi:hypothetical protein
VTGTDNGTFHNCRSANGEYCADELIELASANDRCWHEGEVPPCPLSRRFGSMSGRNVAIVKTAVIERPILL